MRKGGKTSFQCLFMRTCLCFPSTKSLPPNIKSKHISNLSIHVKLLELALIQNTQRKLHHCDSGLVVKEPIFVFQKSNPNLGKISRIIALNSVATNISPFGFNCIYLDVRHSPQHIVQISKLIHYILSTTCKYWFLPSHPRVCDKDIKKFKFYLHHYGVDEAITDCREVGIHNLKIQGIKSFCELQQYTIPFLHMYSQMICWLVRQYQYIQLQTIS